MKSLEATRDSQCRDYLDLNDFDSALKLKGIYTDEIILGWIENTWHVAWNAALTELAKGAGEIEPTQDEAIEITCASGEIALISECDAEYIQKYKWSIGDGYARRGYRNAKGQITVFMHRDIMRPPEGFEVDHINGNRLDNRRSNLRLVTRAQNQMNKIGKDGTSKYKGVYSQQGKWSVMIAKGGVRRCVSGIIDEEIAARIYDLLAIDTFGEYSRTNFIDPRQMAARVGFWMSEAHLYAEWRDKLQAQCDGLTARAERELTVNSNLAKEYIEKHGELMAKLAAAEARIRELALELAQYVGVKVLNPKESK